MQSTSGRRSFRHTSAARVSRSAAVPAAIEPIAPAEHGITAMPSTAVLPEAILAPISLFGRNSIFAAAVPVSIAGSFFGSLATKPSSPATKRKPASLATKNTCSTRVSRSSIRRRACAYTAPLAPVMPTVITLPLVFTMKFGCPTIVGAAFPCSQGNRFAAAHVQKPSRTASNSIHFGRRVYKCPRLARCPAHREDAEYCPLLVGLIHAARTFVEETNEGNAESGRRPAHRHRRQPRLFRCPSRAARIARRSGRRQARRHSPQA